MGGALGDLVAKAAALASTAVLDPLNHVLGGYSRYTPRMLRTLDIKASPAAEPLLEAVGVLRSNGPADRLPAADAEHAVFDAPAGDRTGPRRGGQPGAGPRRILYSGFLKSSFR